MARDVYLFEELDEATADYLRGVKRTEGEGQGGIYLSTEGLGAGCALTVGLVILVATVIAVSPPLNAPTNAAMLLTAGILLGGWLVLAGIRMYVARSSGSNIGSFLYADPWRLWKVNSPTVELIDLDPVSAVKLDEVRTSAGAYQNSTVRLKTPEGEDQVTMTLEIGAKEIHAWIEYWLEKRGGRPLTPAVAAQFAAAAKAYAYDLDQPPNVVVPKSIPKPNKVREANSGWLNLLFVMAAGVALFFALHPLVIAWRDEAIFDLVRNGPPRELRGYLVDPRNTHHREKVRQLLAARYETPIAAFKDTISQKADPKLADCAEPMAELLKGVATALQPIVTVRVREKPAAGIAPAVDPNQPPVDRPAKVQSMIADALLSVIGQDMLSVAQAPEGIPGFIEIEYELVPDMGRPSMHLDATITLRKNPDEDFSYRGQWQSPSFPPEKIDDNLRQIVKAFTGIEPTAEVPGAVDQGRPWE